MHASRPLNIAMLSIHSSPLGKLGTITTGGMSIYVRELASEMAMLGHTVDIYTCAGMAGYDPVIELAKNVRLIHLSIPEAKISRHQDLFPLLPHIFELLENYTSKEELRYDIVHSHYWLSGCLGIMIQEKWQIPHITMFHTLGLMKAPTSQGENETKQRISQEKKLVSHCQRIIAPTHQEKKNLTEIYHSDPDKIDIIPGGVDLNLFKIGHQEDARKSIHFDCDEPLLLFAGRFAPEKGLALLFEALQLLHRKTPVTLLIIGGDNPNDPIQQDLADQAALLQMNDHIHFVGRVDHQQLPPYYNAADLVVMPSLYESFGLVCLEALACGTPVVSSPVGIMPSILDGKINGTTIPELNSSNLATAIKNFCLNKRSTAFEPQQVRKTVEKFSWQYVATQTLLAYDDLIFTDVPLFQRNTNEYSN